MSARKRNFFANHGKNALLGNVGIYAILNDVNGDAYVGQSIDIDKRIGTHLAMLQYRKHENHKMQDSYDRFGKIAFTGEILETMPADVFATGYARTFHPWACWMDRKEAEYIRLLTPNLNIGPQPNVFRSKWVSLDHYRMEYSR